MTDLSRRAVLAGGAAVTAFGRQALAATTIDDALVAAAKKEGKLTGYTVLDPGQAQSVIAAFNAKFGITIDNERLLAAPLMDRLNAEAGSGNYVCDVVITTDRTQALTAIDKKWLAPMKGLPYLDLYTKSDYEDYWVNVGHIPYSLVWNKDEFPETPKGWKDLLDPKYKDRVMMIDPRIGAGPSQFYAMCEQVYGVDFIKQLGKVAQFVTSVVPGVQQIAAGAKGIYAPGVHTVVGTLIAKGAHIGEIFPEPTVATENYTCIMAHAPHPNAAKLLVAWLMSPEGQAVVNKDGFSSLPNIPGTRPLPKLLQVDPVAAGAKAKEYAGMLGLS